MRAALAAPTYIRPGTTRSKVPHARCEGAGSRGMGPFFTAASFSHVEIRSHIHLGSHMLLLSPLRTAPRGPGQFQDNAITPPAACAPMPRWRLGDPAFQVDTRPEPDAQIAVGLIAQPQPGEFDPGGSPLAVASFTDALVHAPRFRSETGSARTSISDIMLQRCERRNGPQRDTPVSA